MKGKAIKPSAYWFWKPSQNLSNKGPNNNSGTSQNNIDDKGYWDSGCSRHMTGNISYLSNYEPFDGGYVSFGQVGRKITGKGTIKTECIVLGRDFKLLDDANILLRTPRQHNMYSIDLNNIVPDRDLTCLVAKASADECMLWHRRLGKQHKATCKSKLVNSVTKPLHTLHMDLFGPTSISSISRKWYCLVVTDDFSRFTWTFFIKTKYETSGILKKFITEIENLKDLKVKITRCDNGGEFRNKKMNIFCSQKGIKKEFSNARTPQQNGVAERRNRTLIKAAKTMLADAKFLVTFWAEAVNTACYVQNRVLVNKSHNKTPYELFNGRTPTIGFIKPFGCHVMILNTLDNLGKFKEKGDEGYFIGYSMSSKAFRVFNKRTRRVEENLHVEFLENNAIEKGAGPNCGNPNPTASTSNPPMEILTVESLIPTVSSPVPIVYSTDSQEPSNILGVTTNLDESNGVEADISNMEIAITTSPTPTLRIHKDHPKSQIIGPLDTPIQTKTSPKRIKAIRLFLAYASFMGFTVYQMDVKSAFLYGTINEEVGTIDQTLFIIRQRGDVILVQVYVDDIIFGSSNPQLCRELKPLCMKSSK
nr:hypothetical protein [Tanacetum cinerariifolium]